MIQALLMMALQGTPADNTVYRRDPNRGAYQEAVDTCRDAEKLLATSPEAALEKLAPIFKDWLDNGRFTLVERRIFIEAKSQEFTPHDFYPYHLRGRARLLAARKRKDEEARKFLIDAVADFRKSPTRSADPLAEALKELWENVRAALTYEGWEPGRAGSTDQSFALLATTDLSKDVAAWTVAEIGRVEARLRDLRKEPGDLDSRRPPARLAARWCEAVAAAVGGIPAFQPVLAAAGKTGVLAVSIRDSRGTFRLKIGVNPWASVQRLQREGEEILLADRVTPLLVPQELEIDDYTIELVHPNGRKNARISANSLQPGRMYVLWGDMNGDKFEVSELPK